MSKVYSITDEVTFEFAVSLEISDNGPAQIVVRTCNWSTYVPLSKIDLALFVEDEANDDEVKGRLVAALKELGDRVLSSGEEVIY